MKKRKMKQRNEKLLKKKSFVSAFHDLIVNLEVGLKMAIILCRTMRAGSLYHL